MLVCTYHANILLSYGKAHSHDPTGYNSFIFDVFRIGGALPNPNNSTGMFLFGVGGAEANPVMEWCIQRHAPIWIPI